MIKSNIIKSLRPLPLVCCSLAIMACGEDRTHEYDEKTMTAHWMVEAMQENYLWGDSIKSEKLGWKDYFSKPEQFLKKLTAMAPVEDNWSWCAIDTTEENHFKRGQFDYLNSYGLDFTVMTDPTGATSRQYARITTVYPNTPAERAGLMRGDFIGAIDGSRFTSSLSSSLTSGRAHRLAVSKLGVNAEEATYLWTQTDTVNIEKSQRVQDLPFPVARTMQWGSHMISYFFVTHLDEGSSANKSEYADQLARQMETFRTYAPDVFILDLRLCNYGSLPQAIRMASYIVPEATSAQNAFAQTLYRNDKQNQNQQYFLEPSLRITSIKRLYIITGPYTSGAGEWLVRGLQSVTTGDVVTIYGRQTTGQIVMTGNVPSEYYVTVHPAVAYVANGSGNYDYAEGIAPDTVINEAEYVDLYPYGDEEEVILTSILKSLQ